MLARAIRHGARFFPFFFTLLGIEAEFVLPMGVAVDAKNGMLFIADSGNHRVRMLAKPPPPRRPVPTVSLPPQVAADSAVWVHLRQPDTVNLQRQPQPPPPSQQHQPSKVHSDSGNSSDSSSDSSTDTAAAAAAADPDHARRDRRSVDMCNPCGLLDVNGDGKITKAKLVAVLCNTGDAPLSAEEAEGLFRLGGAPDCKGRIDLYRLGQIIGGNTRPGPSSDRTEAITSTPARDCTFAAPRQPKVASADSVASVASAGCDPDGGAATPSSTAQVGGWMDRALPPREPPCALKPHPAAIRAERRRARRQEDTDTAAIIQTATNTAANAAPSKVRGRSRRAAGAAAAPNAPVTVTVVPGKQRTKGDGGGRWSSLKGSRERPAHADRSTECKRRVTWSSAADAIRRYDKDAPAKTFTCTPAVQRSGGQGSGGTIVELPDAVDHHQAASVAEPGQWGAGSMDGTGPAIDGTTDATSNTSTTCTTRRFGPLDPPPGGNTDPDTDGTALAEEHHAGTHPHTISGVITCLGLDAAREQALRRRLHANGIAGLKDLAKVSDTQMREMLGVVKLGHRRKIAHLLEWGGFTKAAPKAPQAAGDQVDDRRPKSPVHGS